MSIGTDTHRRFAGRPGSDFIATAFALDGLAEELRRRRPRTVLEVGPGIGTTTSVTVGVLDELWRRGGYRLYGIEHVPFCLEQMATNLGDDLAATTVVERYEDLPGDRDRFDFVLVDGGGEGHDDGDLDPDHVRAQNRLYVSELSERAVVFVENKRPRQRAIFEAAIEGPWSYAHHRPWNDAPGYHVYRLDPTPAERREATLHGLADRLWFDSGAARGTARTLRRIRRRLRPPAGRAPAAGGP